MASQREPMFGFDHAKPLTGSVAALGALGARAQTTFAANSVHQSSDELPSSHPLMVQMAECQEVRASRGRYWSQFAAEHPEAWANPASYDRSRWNEEKHIFDKKIRELSGRISLTLQHGETRGRRCADHSMVTETQRSSDGEIDFDEAAARRDDRPREIAFRFKGSTLTTCDASSPTEIEPEVWDEVTSRQTLLSEPVGRVTRRRERFTPAKELNVFSTGTTSRALVSQSMIFTGTATASTPATVAGTSFSALTVDAAVRRGEVFASKTTAQPVAQKGFEQQPVFGQPSFLVTRELMPYRLKRAMPSDYSPRRSAKRTVCEVFDKTGNSTRGSRNALWSSEDEETPSPLRKTAGSSVASSPPKLKPIDQKALAMAAFRGMQARGLLRPTSRLSGSQEKPLTAAAPVDLNVESSRATAGEEDVCFARSNLVRKPAEKSPVATVKGRGESRVHQEWLVGREIPLTSSWMGMEQSRETRIENVPADSKYYDMIHPTRRGFIDGRSFDIRDQSQGFGISGSLHPSTAPADVSDRVLFVAPLPLSFRQGDVRALFGRFEIEKISVHAECRRQSKGVHAFMVMKSTADAEQAIRDNEDTYLNGQQLIVSAANLSNHEEFDGEATTSGYEVSDIPAHLMQNAFGRLSSRTLRAPLPALPHIKMEEGMSEIFGLDGEPASREIVRYQAPQPSPRQTRCQEQRRRQKEAKRATQHLQQIEARKVREEISNNTPQIKIDVKNKLANPRQYPLTIWDRTECIARMKHVEGRLHSLNSCKQQRLMGKVLKAKQLELVGQEESLLALLVEFARSLDSDARD